MQSRKTTAMIALTLVGVIFFVSSMFARAQQGEESPVPLSVSVNQQIPIAAEIVFDQAGTEMVLSDVPATLQLDFQMDLTQAQQADRAYMELTDEFFRILAEEGSGPAFDYILSTSPYFDLTSSDVINMKDQFASIEAAMGSYIGHEVLLEERVTDQYVYLYFFVAYDLQPLKFEMFFYRPTGEWRLQNINFDTNIAQDVAAMALNP
jgi:hypothetical protein